MKNVTINDKKYQVIEDFKDGYNQEAVEEKLTDFFDVYDYIVGDWSYGKLRLKGFCKVENKRYNNVNDFNKKDDYIKNGCAYGCKYFVLEKVKEEK